MDKDLRNPFHEMEDDHISRHFDSQRSERIKNNLDGDLGKARRLGNISDVYIKRFADVVMGMFGSSQDRTTTPQRGSNDASGEGSKYPNQDGY